ncbi:MAG: helix-turn-helix transcriptional regulator [Flavonifractor sp.]|jgi:transcriptional regulator with XRE-family HTH domain|nr:helix-turn-helix transcriptional regulator [Flavonifractor sp.]MCI9424582.1 helix-turn-helix transcriptional regulator [Flavonifractor sp.]MCI9473365.1 helix-turn-helix transcriptional regulator [Flavonifractor sp.]
MKTKQDVSRFRDNYIGIGIRISYFRRLRGLSQEQLAERAGISPGFLSQVEAPGMAVGLSLNTLFAISEVLDVPAYKLLQLDS